MKSEKETKSALQQRRTSYWLAVFLFLCLCFTFTPTRTTAQLHTFRFSAARLSDALQQVAEKMNFNVAFDSKAMAGLSVSGTFEGKTPDAILTELLQHTGYTTEQKFGNYLIIPVPSQDGIHRIFNHVSGLVSDLVSGEQLPHAGIYLPAQNLVLGTSVNGTFAFRIPAADSLRIMIQYLGYQSVDSIVAMADSTTVLSFRMKQRNMELEPVQIRSARLKMIDQNRDAGHSTVNPVGFVDLPNMGENDIFRTIQLLPGIGYSENSSGLNIRGGTADQNLVLFDGFTLYNLDHFFGTFSSVNPNVVKDIQIFKGGFDSRYGERLSGIIDITGKTGNKYSPKINGGLNLVSGNLTAELPISDKLSLVVAGRRSYADIYSSYLVDNMLENQVEEVSLPIKTQSIVQLEPGYYFYDYNAKLTFSRNEQEKISVSVFGGKDFLTSTGEGRNKLLFSKTTDDTTWGNYGFSTSWIKQWRKRLFSNLQIGYSGYENRYDNVTVVGTRLKNKYLSVRDFDTYEKNSLNDFSVSFRNTWTIDFRNSIDFGLQTKYNESAYLKNSGTDAVYADIDGSSWLYSSFVQSTNQLVKNLVLKIGGRISSYNHSGKLFYEPRFSGNYKINEFFSLKLATGKYHQFLSRIASTQTYGYNRDFWIISDEKIHPVMSSNHLIAGTNFMINRFSVDIEAYYKSVEGLQLFMYIPPFQQNSDPGSFQPRDQLKRVLPNKFITGTGQAVGLDVLLKYESSRFTSWMAYSLSEASRNFTEINRNETIPAPYDKTHELKWTNLLALGKWNFSGLWIYSTGQPYISSQVIDKKLTAKLEYDRLPDFKRLDVAANYNFRFRKVQVKLGMSVINLLNADNYNDIYSRDFNFDTTNFNETTYVRSLGITPNFFVNFHY